MATASTMPLHQDSSGGQSPVPVFTPGTSSLKGGVGHRSKPRRSPVRPLAASRVAPDQAPAAAQPGPAGQQPFGESTNRPSFPVNKFNLPNGGVSSTANQGAGWPKAVPLPSKPSEEQHEPVAFNLGSGDGQPGSLKRTPGAHRATVGVKTPTAVSGPSSSGTHTSDLPSYESLAARFQQLMQSSQALEGKVGTTWTFPAPGAANPQSDTASVKTAAAAAADASTAQHETASSAPAAPAAPVFNVGTTSFQPTITNMNTAAAPPAPAPAPAPAAPAAKPSFPAPSAVPSTIPAFPGAPAPATGPFTATAAPVAPAFGPAPAPPSVPAPVFGGAAAAAPGAADAGGPTFSVPQPTSLPATPHLSRPPSSSAGSTITIPTFTLGSSPAGDLGSTPGSRAPRRRTRTHISPARPAATPPPAAPPTSTDAATPWSHVSTSTPLQAAAPTPASTAPPGTSTPFSPMAWSPEVPQAAQPPVTPMSASSQMSGTSAFAMTPPPAAAAHQAPAAAAAPTAGNWGSFHFSAMPSQQTSIPEPPSPAPPPPAEPKGGSYVFGAAPMPSTAGADVAGGQKSGFGFPAAPPQQQPAQPAPDFTFGGPVQPPAFTFTASSGGRGQPAAGSPHRKPAGGSTGSRSSKPAAGGSPSASDTVQGKDNSSKQQQQQQQHPFATSTGPASTQPSAFTSTFGSNLPSSPGASFANASSKAAAAAAVPVFPSVLPTINPSAVMPGAAATPLRARRHARTAARSTPTRAATAAGAPAAAPAAPMGPAIPLHVPPVLTPDELMTQRAEARLQKANALKIQGNELFSLGNFAESEAAYSAALEALGEARASSTDMAVLHSNRAGARIMIGKPQSALSDALRAVSLDPKFFRAISRAATCHCRMGDFQAAQRVLDKGLDRLSPSSTHFKELYKKQTEIEHVVRSVAAASELVVGAGDSLDKLQQSIATLAQVQPLVSFSEPVAALRAVAYLACSKFSEAQSVCEVGYQAPDVIPAAPWRSWVVAQALMLSGDVQAGLTKCSALSHALQAASLLDAVSAAAAEGEAAAFGGTSAVALRAAGLRLPTQAELAYLAQHAKQLLQLKEEGNAAYKAGKHQAAVDKYSAALTLGAPPAFAAVLHSNRAAAHQSLGSLTDALADCVRARALDPTYARALTRLATLLQDARRPSVAQKLLEAALEPGAGSSLSASDKQAVLQGIEAAKDAARWQHTPDHYKILGLERTCTEDEVRKAYRRAALKYHPDKAVSACKHITWVPTCSQDTTQQPSTSTPGRCNVVLLGVAAAVEERVRQEANWLFNLISSAHEELSDKSKKRKVDIGLASDTPPQVHTYRNSYSAGYGYGYDPFASGYQGGYGGTRSSGFGFAPRGASAAQPQRQSNARNSGGGAAPGAGGQRYSGGGGAAGGGWGGGAPQHAWARRGGSAAGPSWQYRGMYRGSETHESDEDEDDAFPY